MTQSGKVVSGMRPTGEIHLGHYHGVIKNWIELQMVNECFFFVADWHALTTHYEKVDDIKDDTLKMVIDWLACGINPGTATLFVQSQVPEHAELALLLSMITPLGWLERVPSYKDYQEKEKEKGNLGFLAYPLLQTADILIYKADKVPVGEDQVAHVELSREIARRFNHIYGSEKNFEEYAEQAIEHLGSKNAELYRSLRKRYQEEGDSEVREVANALLDSQQNITLNDKERLLGYLDGMSRILLPEPQALLAPASKIPGTDGQKMSKSLANTIMLRDEDSAIDKKLRTMLTDPARQRRNDPGDPEKCPVWEWHKVYSDDAQKAWVVEGCKSAGIGCIDCKKVVIDKVQSDVSPIRQKIKEYEADIGTVKKIISEGNEAARDIARDTMEEVRSAMKIAY